LVEKLCCFNKLTWIRYLNFLDQPDIAMRPEFPALDQDKMASPHAQEVEYALILSRIISTVKEDPSQLRLTIYEFARARLKLDTALLDGPERRRLSEALETAIQGVEQFSARRDERERLCPPIPLKQIRMGPSPTEATSIVTVDQLNSARAETVVSRVYVPRDRASFGATQARILLSRRAGFWISILLFGVIMGSAYYNQERSFLQMAGVRLSSSGEATAAKQASTPSVLVQPPPQQAPVAVEAEKSALSNSPPPFPLPTDYGVYAASNSAPIELHPLSERVPDKRIAMSTPVTEPSRTTLPDGRAKFVLFRRDLAGNAPDRIDVRVVAQVMRALTFDAKRKASFTPVSDAWNIRNLSYEFRVRPLPGNPEMLLVLPANADFVLPAGRYVLVLGTQGYDFTVAGQVTDPSQCLERTDAANGAFYSDCQKQ
jgi:hypothetical protein